MNCWSLPARRLPRPLRALALAAVLAMPPAVAPDAAPAGTVFAHPAAQPGLPSPEADPPLEVTVFGNTVTVRTLPGVIVVAELLDADGPKVGGQGYSGPDGRADVRFFGFDDPEADAVVRPGDTLRLVALGERPRTVGIPNLTADVDVALDRVLGTAPPSTLLDIALVLAGPVPASVERQVTAAADGTFVLDLQAEVDLPVGGVTGTVAFVDAEGTRFSANVAALRADVTLGSGWVRGAVTPGTHIDVHVRSAANGNQGSAPVGEVVGAPCWSARLPSTAAGPGPGPGPRPVPFPGGQGGAEHPVAPGDRITVTVSGGPLGALGAGRVLTATVPALAIDVDPSDESVAGTGPADAELIIEASSLDGQALERRIRSDAGGAFALSLADAVDLGPGWRVKVLWEAAPGLRVGALAAIPLTQVAMGTDSIVGLADVGTQVTVTVRSAAGDALWQRALRADDRGEYRTQPGFFIGNSAVPLAAGMRVEVAEVAGDPRVLDVPPLTAAPDEPAGAITGSAPPGAVVRVAATDGPTVPALSVTADASGRYRADVVAAGWSLDGPLSGTAALDAPDGFRVVARWAVVRLGLTLDEHVVVGNGPLGRQVAGELLDGEGRVVARSNALVPDFGGANVVIIGGAGLGGFTLQFLDVAGDPVPVRAGDAVRVTAGDGATVLAVPELTAAVFVADDVITGRTAPDAAITIRVQPAIGGHGAQAEVTADAAGAFAHDFTDEYDVRHRDRVQLEVRPAGHRVTARVPVAGLDLDLDTARLTGALAPDARLTIRLERAGRTLAETTATAAEDGTFALGLVGGGALRQGDVIEVAEVANGGDRLSLVVPELTIDAAAGARAVSGRAAPGGTLVVLSTGSLSSYVDGTLAQAWPEIAADGRWSAELVPTTQIAPGMALIGQYQLPSGHVVRRTAFVPLLVVDHGGARACGVAQPGQAVSARLEGADGALRAQASGAPDPDGRFGLRLADGAGTLVATGAGDTVRAELAGRDVALHLPQLDLVYDPASGRLFGTGAPGAQYRVSYPARRCTGDDAADFLLVFGGPSRVAADGTVNAFFPADFVAPGDGFEIAFTAQGGHAYRRQLWRSLGRVHVGTARVAGRAQPLTPVTVTLRLAAGAERAVAHTRADADGDWAIGFVDGADPVASAPGDAVVVSAAEDIAAPAEIGVLPLAFDWSPGRAVLGTAPAGRPVLLELRLRSGRVLAIGRLADETGRFGFAADEVPLRAGWTLEDVVALRATLTTDEGHAMVAETEGFEGPLPQDGSRIYLPSLLSGAAVEGRDLAWEALGEEITSSGWGSDAWLDAAHRRPMTIAIGR